MRCPKCGRSYIERKVFSEHPPIDVIIHDRKRVRIKRVGYVQEATDICYIHKEQMR